MHDRSRDAGLRECWARLGISEDLLQARGLPLFDDAADLRLAQTDADGRTHMLVPEAAAAWSRMRTAAQADGVVIHIVSAHRSIARQVEILERKLAAGQTIEQILSVSAPPGCSEHHTGRAVDVGTPGAPPLEAAFEHTPAFQWLTANAGRYGFRLSFPADNPWGYDYEPWHWCHHGSEG